MRAVFLRLSMVEPPLIVCTRGWIRAEGLIPAVLGNALRRNIRVLKPTVTTSSKIYVLVHF